jgi:hypothetical protein
MRLGEKVRVSYFPAHPQTATMAADKEQGGYLKDAVAAGIFMASFVTFAVLWKYFRSRRTLPQSTP